MQKKCGFKFRDQPFCEQPKSAKFWPKRGLFTALGELENQLAAKKNCATLTFGFFEPSKMGKMRMIMMLPHVK